MTDKMTAFDEDNDSRKNDYSNADLNSEEGLSEKLSQNDMDILDKLLQDMESNSSEETTELSNGFSEVESSADELNADADDSNDADMTLDDAFKKLFEHVNFLAPIILNVVPGCKKYSLEEIAKSINVQHVINGDAETSVPVNESILTSIDQGQGDETTVYYDVLIHCSLPGVAERFYLNFYLDLEMQRKNDPGYPIATRGLYYCCRLISRQIESLGDESYNQIQPVYSVWIIRNIEAKYLRNTIFEASMHGGFLNEYAKRLQGKLLSKKQDALNAQIDYLHLVLIYLSKELNFDNQANDLIKYLVSVFKNKVSDPELNPYAGFAKSIMKEVNKVMTMDQIVRQEGRQEEKQETAIRMLKNGRSISTIMEDTGLILEEVKELQESLQK